MGRSVGRKSNSYAARRGTASIHKMTRNYVKSFFNYCRYDEDIMEEFIYPHKYANTYNWFDVSPSTPRVFKQIRF